MASRALKDLNKELVTRWQAAYNEWVTKFPDDPEPFITQTYRSPEEQDELYIQGRTVPGKIVTNARGGQSLHNYYPSYAFDIAFKKGKNIFWDEKLFKRFGTIATKFGLGWGGLWTGGFKDLPHFEPPNFTWKDARADKEPKWGK